jgi:hypothetical protein
LSSSLETRILSLKKCVGIFTDDVPSMVSSIRGFAFLVKEKNTDVTTHSFIHREVLVSKILRDEMEKFWMMLTKMINVIKQKPVHSRMFKETFVKIWTNSA